MANHRPGAVGICLALATTFIWSAFSATPARAQSAAGRVAFSAPGYSVAVSAGMAIITIDRLGGSTGGANATYRTFDSSALAGRDYTETSGTVSWSDGDATPRTVGVPISTAAVEGGVFTVALTAASGAAFGNPLSATVSIDEPAASPLASTPGVIQFSQATYCASPEDTAVIATVNRVQGSRGAAIASYTTLDGSAVAGTGYTRTSGTLQWADGVTTPISISVPIKPGAAGGSFSLALISASGTGFGEPIQATISMPQTSASSGACASAALLSYLNGLPDSSEHILIGQHTNYWDAIPTDDLTGLFQQTGKNPAIVGVQIDSGSSPEGVAGGPYSGVTLANSYLGQGYMVMITEVPGSPLNGTAMFNQTLITNSPMPAANFTNITTPGTAEYNAFQIYLQQMATALKQINGPVLFRPFAEQNGNWFWYGDQNPAQFIAMWQMEHDYMVAQGLTNLLWVFAANVGVGNYSTYYPGSEYVDVVGLDAYPPSAQDTQAWQQLGALGKPEIYAEAGATLVSESVQVGADTLDNSAILSLVEQNFPQVVGVVVWCQSIALDNQNGAAAVMDDPQVITLNTLPFLP
jgi:hypothetical protein